MKICSRSIYTLLQGSVGNTCYICKLLPQELPQLIALSWKRRVAECVTEVTFTALCPTLAAQHELPNNRSAASNISDIHHIPAVEVQLLASRHSFIFGFGAVHQTAQKVVKPYISLVAKALQQCKYQPSATYTQGSKQQASDNFHHYLAVVGIF